MRQTPCERHETRVWRVNDNNDVEMMLMTDNANDVKLILI